MSTLLESLTAINFQLKTAREKEERAKTIKPEITKLEKEIASLIPLIEKQTALEEAEQELNSKHAAVKSFTYADKEKYETCRNTGHLSDIKWC